MIGKLKKAIDEFDSEISGKAKAFKVKVTKTGVPANGRSISRNENHYRMLSTDTNTHKKFMTLTLKNPMAMTHYSHDSA